VRGSEIYIGEGGWDRDGESCVEIIDTDALTILSLSVKSSSEVVIEDSLARLGLRLVGLGVSGSSPPSRLRFKTSRRVSGLWCIIVAKLPAQRVNLTQVAHRHRQSSQDLVSHAAFSFVLQMDPADLPHLPLG
jgi:hypothetical protein